MVTEMDNYEENFEAALYHEIGGRYLNVTGDKFNKAIEAVCDDQGHLWEEVDTFMSHEHNPFYQSYSTVLRIYGKDDYGHYEFFMKYYVDRERVREHQLWTYTFEGFDMVRYNEVKGADPWEIIGEEEENEDDF